MALALWGDWEGPPPLAAAVCPGMCLPFRIVASESWA